MSFRNPFGRHNKQERSASQIEDANAERRQSQEQVPDYDDPVLNDQQVVQQRQEHLLSSATTDVKRSQPSPFEDPALPPAYPTTPSQSQSSRPPPPPPPGYRSVDLPLDPHDPRGQPYGYQYIENEQNFPHPSSVSKDIGKPMEKYEDPKAEDLARRASQGGREDLTEMMNYYLRQQELGKKSTDNTIAAWNGV